MYTVVVPFAAFCTRRPLPSYVYVKQEPTEKAKLLKMVLLNCAVDAASVYPTYRKPFDIIFTRTKNEEWRARRDSNSRPSASKLCITKL